MPFCLECGAETVGKFCHTCGTAVLICCPKCGAHAPERAAFCPKCGVRLKAAPLPSNAPASNAHINVESSAHYYSSSSADTPPAAAVTTLQSSPDEPHSKAGFSVWWVLLAVFLTFIIYYILEGLIFALGAAPPIIALRVVLLPMVGFVIFYCFWSLIRGEAP